MLGYRSLFTVDESADLTSDVLAQIHSWLREKNYDADLIRANGDVAAIASHAEAVITTEAPQDGSSSTLFTLREDHDEKGAWITQIIAHVPGHDRGRPWVWIDVEQEGVDDGWAARPRVARSILEVLNGDDHGALLSSAPTLLGGDDVEHLVEVLTNHQRRGPVFVAGSSEVLPIAKWQSYVGRLLGETVGLAAGYVLDGEATVRFKDIVGERHAVRSGTLRTYLPGLDPESELDSFRHRFLTTETIIESPPARIRKTLGLRARDLALTTPVPRWAARVESRLLAATDTRVLGWRPTALVEQDDKGARAANGSPRDGRGSAPLAKRPMSVDRGPAPSVDRDAPAAGQLPLAGAPTEQLARELFGRDLDEALLRALAADRDRAVVLEAENLNLMENIERLNARSTNLNARVLTLEDVLATVRRESDDAQLEWADAEERVAELERTARSLRIRLMRSGQAEAAWTDGEETTDRDHAPESFAELLVRFGEFEHVIFTGRPGPCDVLDQKMQVGASGKAWAALIALEDYARAKASEDVSGGVHQYLLETPVGYVGFSANRHAQTESEDVQNNAKYAGARVFPVPRTIDERGELFMGAHFKLAQFGMISPRLHYHDATGVDGRIYVGYIGPHLPTQMTN